MELLRAWLSDSGVAVGNSFTLTHNLPYILPHDKFNALSFTYCGGQDGHLIIQAVISVVLFLYLLICRQSAEFSLYNSKFMDIIT